MKPSATTRLVRKINQSAILDLVRTSGPISRTEIAHRLHTSLPTVMRIIDDLVAENLVVEDGTFEVNGGRPRALLAFNGQAHTVIGLDLGGTQMVGTVADLNGQVLKEIALPWTSEGAEKNFELVCRLLQDLIDADAPMGTQLLGVGIGVPGVTHPDKGMAVLVPSLEWVNFPLRERLRERFDLLTLIENDVNLAALGEYGFGGQAGAESLVCITVGTGVGAGIVLDRKIHLGHRFAAGEIGYILPGVAALGVKSGDYGPLESLASGTALLRRAAAILREMHDPRADQLFTLQDLYAAVKAGEPWAQSLVDEMTDYLAMAVASVSALIDPEVIVLGGGITVYADEMIPLIMKRLDGVMMYPPRLVKSTLGYRAAVMGAILKVLDAVTEHVSVA